MNTKIATALTIIAAITSLGGSVHAQSSATPKPGTGKYTLNGSSLTGINHRTASNDFARFFSTKNSVNTSEQNTSANISSKNATDNIPPFLPSVPIDAQGNQVVLRRKIEQPLSSPNSGIFPQPDRPFDANDGVQVQVQGQ